ncbi:MAG: hypothetical protein ABIF18_02545 [archaeon]
MKNTFSMERLDEIMGEYSIDNFVDFFRPRYSKTLSMSVGVGEGYSLEEHIRMVLNQFDKYFSHKSLPYKVSNTFFRVFIFLHDIGKPAAVKKGDKHLQHKETLKLIKPILNELKFSDNEIKIALALVDGDPIGSYIKGGDPKKSIIKIKKMAKMSGLPLKEFFSLQIIYYQCDAGSYTEDSGGKRSLDRYFIFNQKNRTLKFSRDIQSRIKALERLLLSSKKGGEKEEGFELYQIWKKYVDRGYAYRTQTKEPLKEVLRDGFDPNYCPYVEIMPKLEKFYDLILKLEKKGYEMTLDWKGVYPSGSEAVRVSRLDLDNPFVDFSTYLKETRSFVKRFRGGAITGNVLDMIEGIKGFDIKLTKLQEKNIKELVKWAKKKMRYTNFLIRVKLS